MKPALTAALFALFAAPAFGARVSLPRLPAPSSFDVEVSTNIALNVNTARLERLSCSIALESCATNEVLFAIGHDLDSDGDLTFGEAALVVPRRPAHGRDICACHERPRDRQAGVRPVLESREGRPPGDGRPGRDGLHRRGARALLDKGEVDAWPGL